MMCNFLFCFCWTGKWYQYTTDRSLLRSIIHRCMLLSNNKMIGVFIALILVENIFFLVIHLVKLITVCCSNGFAYYINIDKEEVSKVLIQMKCFVENSDTSPSVIHTNVHSVD